jgi:hypothetical protein
MTFINDESGNIRAFLQQAAEMESNAANYKEIASRELTRPFMILMPKIFMDGNKWCALYGENIQDGVAGFGDTPEMASKDFDKSWVNGA